jgi:trans-L-3-hydroxyproline dehydratase
MCGHATIAVTKVLLETGAIPIREPQTVVRIDTPSGLVTAYGRVQNGRVESIAFQNVPSYVVSLDETVEVPGLGTVGYDLAFGGAYYAYVQAESLGVGLGEEDHGELIEKGMRIKEAVAGSRSIEHPYLPELGFLYGTIFIGRAHAATSHSRNVCIFAEGEVDRSPTGTGVSGRLAIHYARGEIGIGESIVVESIIGSRFTGRVVREATFGPFRAIVPEVEGTASITGVNLFVLDPRDPLSKGFLLR